MSSFLTQLRLPFPLSSAGWICLSLANYFTTVSQISSTWRTTSMWYGAYSLAALTQQYPIHNYYFHITIHHTIVSTALWCSKKKTKTKTKKHPNHIQQRNHKEIQKQQREHKIHVWGYFTSPFTETFKGITWPTWNFTIYRSLPKGQPYASSHVALNLASKTLWRLYLWACTYQFLYLVDYPGCKAKLKTLKQHRGRYAFNNHLSTGCIH